MPVKEVPIKTTQPVALLASHVIDHIAAGEVIERPASVVKELLDNCIDAGASSIAVDIEGGGLTRITISDDGRGMTAADARLCYYRHATSKLRSSEDLFSIETLGFRGEALSSIASVSQLTLSTRQVGEDSGFRIVLRGGELVEEGPMGCPLGTTFNIENLFYNTPARKKFLKSPATEQAHVVDACLRVALGSPGTGLVLTSGKRRLLDIPEGVGEQLRIQAALGKRVEALFPFERVVDGVRVHGFVTRPELDRGDTKGLWFFVNGRFIKDRMMQRAVLAGYREQVTRGRYPIVVLSVEVDPSVVDVNVHPQKLEVRFSDGGAVFRAVTAAMAEVLTRMPWTDSTRPAGVPAVSGAVKRFYQGSDSAPQPERGAGFGRGGWSGRGTSGGHPGEDRRSHSPKEAWGPGMPHEIASAQPPRASLPSAAALFLGRFWLHEVAGSVRAVDLASAATHLGTEAYGRALNAGNVPREGLLFPEVLELGKELLPLCEAYWESFGQFGFEIEPVGPGCFALRSIPLPLVGAEPRGLVLGFLQTLHEAGFTGAAKAEICEQVLTMCRGYCLLPAQDALKPGMLEALLLEIEKTTAAGGTIPGALCQWTPRELSNLVSRGV